MKTQKLLFALLLMIGFVACNKKNESTSNPDLKRFANELKIIPIWVYGNEAMMSFVEMSNQKDISAVFQIKDSVGAEWQNVPYQDRNNILLPNLKPAKTYYLRVMLTQKGFNEFSKIDSFTTLDYFFEYNKFFASIDGMYDTINNNMVSVEGAKYTVYGGGFKNVPEIMVRFNRLDDAEAPISIMANVLNDSVLNFSLPSDMLSNNPYTSQKTYGCLIGILPLIGYQSYLSHNYFSQGNIYISNSDLQINKINVEKLGCSYVSIEGFFGANATSGHCPDYFLNMPSKIKERKLVVRSAGSGVVNEILVLDKGAVNCDAPAIGVADLAQISRSLPSWHEILQISWRTSLASGAYTIQVVNLSYDGTIYSSNVVPLNIL